MMGTKRPADDADAVRQRPRRETLKRAKLSPPAEENSSDPSSCSVSVDSALQSSPPISEHTRQSSLSSLQSSRHGDSDDSASSSISDDSDDEASEEEIVTLGGPKKPETSGSHFKEGADDLRSRLDSLLPQLLEANKILSDGHFSCSMEDVQDDEQHIEMNLGLGVLEENCEDDTSESSDSSDADSEDENELDESKNTPDCSVIAKRSTGSKKKDAMCELLGQPASQQKVGIEEVG